MRGYNILGICFRLLALLFFLFPMLIFAWTTPLNISNTEGRSKYPAMCQDRRGWLHVVFEDDTQDENDIYYVYYNGFIWSDTLNISHDSTTSWRPDVTVDTLNRVHIVWGNSYTGRIMWTMYDTGGWSTPVSISDLVPYSCHGPELDVSLVSNYVHCVWHNLGDAEIWHAYYNGSVWSIPENVTQDSKDDAWVDVAVDLLGRVHLVWMDYGSGSMDSIEIFYSRFDSISWTPPVNASRIIGGSGNPRISIGNNNNPRIVWEERKGGYSVYYTYFDGVDWVNPVLVDVDHSATPDIAVDFNNHSQIVWRYVNDYNNIDEIYYTVFNDTIMIDTISNISNTDSASATPSIFVDSLIAYIIWNDYTEASGPLGNGEIYYIKGELSGINEIIQPENRKIIYSKFVTSHLLISFSPTESTTASISIYDITGRKVEEISLGSINKDFHQYEIPLTIISGIYFLQVEAGRERWWGKFVLLNP